MKYIVFCIISIFMNESLFADTSNKALLMDNIFNVVSADKFYDEFEITGKVKTCGAGLDAAIGFEAHLIEPLLVSECSAGYWDLPALGESLSTDITKHGVTRPQEPGEDRSFTWCHLWKVPVFNLIFKDVLKGVACFDQGSFSFLYACEIDPIMCQTDRGSQIAEARAFNGLKNPITLLLGTVDCAATETLNLLSNKFGTAAKSANYVRDAMIMNNGCLGFGDSTGAGSGVDPLTDALKQSYKMINYAFSTPGFGLNKTTDLSYGKSSMCKERMWASWLKGQYAEQIVYPTVGKVMEMGVSPMHYSFKNTNLSKDSFVFLFWQRRQYAAFAYFCGEVDDSKGDKGESDE